MTSAGTTYDGLNRDNAITTVGAPIPCSPTGGYDCRGNLANEGAGGRSFGYDIENRLLAVAGASAPLALSYDPLGRLSQTVSNSTTTQFLYDADRLSGEYAGGAVIRRYVHGPGTDEPLVWYDVAGGSSTRHWLQMDHQGSVVAASDDSGAIPSGQLYTYGPYGEPSGWTGSRFRYTGQIVLPEVALYHYKARAYDPLTGRFLQTDPIGYKDDLDLYEYVGDDPIGKSDPLGLRRCGNVPAGYCKDRNSDTGNADNSQGNTPPPPPTHSQWDCASCHFSSTATASGAIANVAIKNDPYVQGGLAAAGAFVSWAEQGSTTKRPSRVRQGTEQQNWDNAPDGRNGMKKCPTCDREVSSQPGTRNKDWDNDHDPKWKDRDLTGKDRKGVLDDYNTNTRLRCVTCNRSDNQ